MFGVSQPSYIDENLTDLPELENEDSERLRSFVVSFEIFKKPNVDPFSLFSGEPESAEESPCACEDYQGRLQD